MKKLVSAASVLSLSVGILIASTASAHAETVRTGDDRLTIPNSSPCRANRPIMEGMVAGAGGQLYIIFSGGSAETPVLSRWVRDGSAWDATSWTCTGPPTVMPELGHGNDLAYNPDYLGTGPALIAAQGSQNAFLDDD